MIKETPSRDGFRGAIYLHSSRKIMVGGIEIIPASKEGRAGGQVLPAVIVVGIP